MERTLKDLLIITRDRLTMADYGICGCIYMLWFNNVISLSEHTILLKYITENKPSNTLHTEFTKSKFWIGDAWWWPEIRNNPKTRQIRIDFINKLINQQP